MQNPEKSAEQLAVESAPAHPPGVELRRIRVVEVGEGNQEGSLTLPVIEMDWLNRMSKICDSEIQKIERGEKTIAEVEAEIAGDIKDPQRRGLVRNMFRTSYKMTTQKPLP